MIYSNSKRVDSERMSVEIITLKDRIAGYQDTIHGLQQTLKVLESTNRKQKTVYESTIAEKDAVVKELTNKIAHKACMLISGMTAGKMATSEGFTCKLYKRAALGLAVFMQDLKRLMIQRTLLYWDDTVIMIQTHRVCIRFDR